MSGIRDEKELAERILGSFWWSRSEGWGDTPDRSSCSMCDAHGGYYDYDVSWHDAKCPVRWACELLGTTDALGKANDIRDRWEADASSTAVGVL